MNHQGLRWNVHCVASVGLRKRLNLYKRGFTIYDLLVHSCFHVERPRPPLGHIKDSRKSRNLRCSLFSPRVGQLWITQSVVFTRQTLLKHKYKDNVNGLVFLFLCNIHFLLVSALDSMGIINTPRRYYLAMECADLVAFTFASWQIRSCLLCELIWPEATVMTFASISCELRQMKWIIWLFHRSELRDRKEDQIFASRQAKNMSRMQGLRHW